MEVKYKLEQAPRKTCIALGFFDGVHLGHQEVIKNTVQKARQTSIIPTVLTFLQNPKSIVKNIEIKRIITQTQKENLLKKLGIELLYAVNFLEIKELTPEAFVEQILVDMLQAKYIFCGFNFRFGKGATATAKDLKSLCQKHAVNAQIIPPICIDNEPVSSTRIRSLIAEGNVKLADTLLGKNLDKK